MPGLLAARSRLILLQLMLAVVVVTAPRPAAAQTDEIQVYNAQIAEPGVVNLTLHNNYTPDGLRAPGFAGGVTPNQSLNGVPEFALGVTKWFEAGLYLPLYSLQRDGRFELNGFKLRALFVAPDAAKQGLFYGVNFEFSFNARHWDPSSYTSEIRPIVGYRVGKLAVMVNPILDNSYKGLSRLDFAPETRIEYALSDKWMIAAEEFDDLGELRRLAQAGRQTHQLFGVLDFNGKPVNVELGAGFGLNRESYHFTLKLILSKDL